VSDLLSLITNSLSHTTQRSPNLPNYTTACKTCVKDLRPSPQMRNERALEDLKDYTQSGDETNPEYTPDTNPHASTQQPASSRKKHRKEKIETWLFNLRLETGLRSPRCRQLQAAQPTFSLRKIPTFGPRKKNSLSLYLYLSRSLKKVRRKYVEKNIERKRCAVDYKTLRGKLAASWTLPSAGPIGTGEGSCGEA